MWTRISLVSVSSEYVLSLDERNNSFQLDWNCEKNRDSYKYELTRLSSYHQLESSDKNKEKEYYERKTMIEKSENIPQYVEKKQYH
jgi:hypothetical protein